MSPRGLRPTSERDEAIPSLTARKHWPSYFAGIATETAYTLILAAAALLLAVVAKVIWQ